MYVPRQVSGYELLMSVAESIAFFVWTKKAVNMELNRNLSKRLTVGCIMPTARLAQLEYWSSPESHPGF